MLGAIPPLPNTSSWRGAWLSTGTNLPLALPSPKVKQPDREAYHSLHTGTRLKMLPPYMAWRLTEVQGCLCGVVFDQTDNCTSHL
jgi:hypothetical protein